MKKNDIWGNKEQNTTVTFDTETLTEKEKQEFLSYIDTRNPAGRTPTTVTTIVVRDPAAANEQKPAAANKPEQAANPIPCRIM